MNRRTEALLSEEIERLDQENIRLHEELAKRSKAITKESCGIGVVSDNRYVDIRILATYIGAKEPTIRDWIRDKKIPFIKMGKLIRFDLQQVEQWLKEKNQKQ